MGKIKVKRGSGVPSGLTAWEIAYDFTNDRFYIGNTTGASVLLAYGGGGVRTVNGFTGGITFAAGTNIGITSSGNIITISATGLSAAASDFVSQGKLSANVGITSGADYVIPFVDDYDPQNWYDPTTKQFKPNIAGYYEISLSAWWAQAGITNAQSNVQARKNGTDTFLIAQNQTQTGSGYSIGGTKTIFLNGSTDYVDFYAYTSNTTSQTLQYGTSYGSGTWFTAFLIANSTPPTAYVSSFNGLTGAVTGVTLGGAAFTGLVSSTVGFSGAGTNLTGNASGLTAGTATSVIVTDSQTNTTFYPTFVGGTGNTGIFIDKSAGAFTYNPGTLELTIGTLLTQYISENAAGFGVSINSSAGGDIQLATYGDINIGDYYGVNNGTYITYNDTFSSLNFNNFSAIQGLNTAYFSNGEYITNPTNGQLDFMPAPSGSTAYGLYMDMTSWGFGVILGTIRSSDSAKNTGGNFRFDVPITILGDTRFQLGSDGHYGLYRTDTGNNTAQLFALSNNANNSGAFALVGYFDVGNANRSPGITHVNPNLYIYANGVTSANDFIRFEHDRTNGNIVSGGTTGILIQPGSGTVGISGGLSAGAYILSSPGVKALTGTTYTFLSADNGTVLTHSNASPSTLTIPTGLPVGYSVTVIQIGAGQVTFSPASGVTMNSYTNLTKIAGQHGSASLVSYQSNIYNLAGNLA